MLGGLAMLLYFSVDAIMHRQRWAAPEILLGTAVYGNWAIWHGSFKAMLAGAGFQLFLAGLAGISCALLFSGFRAFRSGGLLALASGLAFAFAWYSLWYLWILPRFAPLIPQYTSRSVAIGAHALLGLLLSRIPRFYRQLDPDGLNS